MKKVVFPLIGVLVVGGLLYYIVFLRNSTGWKTYHGKIEDVSFQIKYPSDWTFIQREEGAWGGYIFNIKSPNTPSLAEWGIAIRAVNYINPRAGEPGEFWGAGEFAWSIKNGRDEYEVRSMNDERNTYFFATLGRKSPYVFELSYVPSSGDQIQHNPIFEKMALSFKFNK